MDSEETTRLELGSDLTSTEINNNVMKNIIEPNQFPWTDALKEIDSVVDERRE